MTIKTILQQKVKELRDEADVIEAYVNELTGKGFEWDKVTDVQLEVMLDVIDMRVSRKKREGKNEISRHTAVHPR